MAKKRSAKSAAASPAPAARTKGVDDDQASIQAPGGHQFHAMREVIESVAVAFVLAFLFRTFVAEAFVIPTGSMSPALQGRHKDVDCAKCGYRFQVTASNEDPDDIPMEYRRDPTQAQTVGGMCPMCRYLMPFRPDLLPHLLATAGNPEPEFQPSYPGDRIVVNKFGLDFTDPERWDVVVFKYPGDGNMNYIKRLTGLPGDSLRIYQGDVFVQPGGEDKFAITRRSPETLTAMLQPVHDTMFEPSELYGAGWPLRWAATTAGGWQHAAEATPYNVEQSFSIDAPATEDDDGDVAWIRYRHLVPDELVWEAVRQATLGELTEQELQELAGAARPELISDFNPYNARLQRDVAEHHGWQVTPPARPRHSGSTGFCWVGDLALECDATVEAARGQLLLDLVEAGYHFRAAIALDSGDVICSIVDGRTGKALKFKATGKTSVAAPGDYELRFANVDDRLWLWVDGKPVPLDGAAYDPDELLGGRQSMIPWSRSDDGGDQGDLAPAGVGARGAKLRVERLAVFRDIYYIAAKHDEDERRTTDTTADYPPLGAPMRDAEGDPIPQMSSVEQFFVTPAAWPRFERRRAVEFSVGKDQFFVMGDNSPESLDARLWTDPRGGRGGGIPGGHYVDRRLLIGKAVAVFWPHSWGQFPGGSLIPVLTKLPGFPNFGDMRLVR